MNFLLIDQHLRACRLFTLRQEQQLACKRALNPFCGSPPTLRCPPFYLPNIDRISEKAGNRKAFLWGRWVRWVRGVWPVCSSSVFAHVGQVNQLTALRTWARTKGNPYVFVSVSPYGCATWLPL